MTALYNLEGMQFGNWTVVERSNTHRRHLWLCRCICGNIGFVSSGDLRYGKSRQCRHCADVQAHTIHQQTGTPVYRSWSGMIQRCYNPNNPRYKDYGGRGIQVCVEWKNNFMNFYTWAISAGWKKGLTIERVDNDGDYRSENCRWATKKQQNRNRRSNRPVTINGRTKLIVEWAEEYNVDYNAMYKIVLRRFLDSRTSDHTANEGATE